MYRYIGNKTIVLDRLMPILLQDTVRGSVVADLMCGTASVSNALKLAGMRVVAGDLMTFAVNHAKSRLLLSEQPDFSSLSFSYSQLIDLLNNLQPRDGYFWREFSDGGSPSNGSPPRNYLTSDNARHLDAISAQLAEWHINGEINDIECAILRNDLVLAVNRVANIAGTYGHFCAQFSRSSLNPLKLSEFTFDSNARIDHEIVQGRAEETIKRVRVDSVYLDPPYMKRQYGANYHLLETIAVGDEPIPRGRSGLRDWWPQYSDFCSKKKMPGALESIVGSGSARRYFVSYSEDGLLEVDVVCDILRKFGPITKHSFEHARFKSNRSSLPRALVEYVLEVRTE